MFKGISNIKIKINGIQVPLYITTIESFVPIFNGLNWQTFVNYNSDGTLEKNANASVNYYTYNPQTLHLELISSTVLNMAGGMYKLVNGTTQYSNTGTWNARVWRAATGTGSEWSYKLGVK